ncbi:MAG: BTAD domain-containing putative transcriptional regulator [Nocardioides sp.]
MGGTLIRFHALGGLTVTDEGDELGIGGSRQRRLLAMLLIHRNSVVSVDRLADAVFAGEPTPAASTTLRSYIARTRRLFNGSGSSSLLVTRAPGYVLQAPGESFDVARFEKALAVGGSHLARDDAPAATSALREALALWRGDAYAEFADEDWARPEAQRLEELRMVALERVIEAELVCGRAAALIPEIESLTQKHPLREEFRAQLMVALYRGGRHADALRVFREYRALLVEELGVDPSPALAAIEQRVLRHDPGLLLTEPAGRRLRGYRLGERLGTGRDGTVYAGSVPGVDREFAIRVVREDIADSPGFVRGFEARSQQLAALRHPGIVPIHDYWREPGAAFLVMRRLSGGSLAHRLEGGPLDDDALVALVTRIGGALAAAAGAGIVHGRVVPESVLYDAAGQPHLTDFALAPPDDPSLSESDDVHDFAAMIAACQGLVRAPLAEVLARAAGTVGRPPVADLVPLLIAAITGERPDDDAARLNPYKGLRAFEEADADDFFGREDLVDEMVDRLREDGLRGRLVLVVGGSGSGKSSVVRAGLLPRIRRGDVIGSQQWFVTTMTPASSPFIELAESLRRVAVAAPDALADRLAEGDSGIDRVLRRMLPGDGQLLLVVDQLEELFTLASAPDQGGFLRGLMHAVSAADSRLRLVATLRADFYDRPLAYQPLGSAVSEATLTTTAMLPSELEAAIVEPAERAGGRVDRALVAELVGAMADEPAALPSLQYTLYELAERSPSRCLDLASYRQLGGVGGAIASRAERLYSSLGDTERVAVRRVFERLVILSVEGEPTRRRAARLELTGLGAGRAVDIVIDRWAHARLLTLDRDPRSRVPTVEIAHEALLREWPRLRGWIEEDREAIGALDRLREAAATWVDLGRDPGALYRGARLESTLEHPGLRPADLPPTEQEFLAASTDARNREQREETEQVARRNRDNRRLRVQRAAIAGALVVALIGGFIAFDQRRQAEGERRVATARELAAAAVSNISVDPERSILLALAAIEETRSVGETVLPEAVEALHRAVTASRVVMRVPDIGGGLDWSPDGRLFVTEGPEESGIVDIRDADTGESIRAFRGHRDDINDVAFTEDGSVLATSGDDGTLRLWDSATGSSMQVVREPGARGSVRDRSVWSPSFSPDGTLVAASWPGTVRVIDVRTGRIIMSIPADGPVGTAFSPDGERLVYGTEGPTVVADARTGDELFSVGQEGARDVSWSPDGRWLATTGSHGMARVWDGETGRYRFPVTGHTGQIWNLDWSPVGHRLATAGDDGSARVSEITRDGALPLLTFSAQETSRGGGFIGVSFSPDGRRLMAGDLGVTSVTVWDADPLSGGEFASTVGSAGLTPDGQTLVVGDTRGSVRTIDSETGRRLTTIREPGGRGGPIWGLDLSGTGERVALLVPRGITVLDVATGDRVFTVPWGDADWVWDMAWSRDGTRLAIAFATDHPTRTLLVVDETGAEVGWLPEEPGFNTRSVSFSSDGRQLATTRWGIATTDPTRMPVRTWDLERGSVLARVEASAEFVAVDPTGTLIATSRPVEGIAELWNADTGERTKTLTATAHVVDLAFDSSGSRLATAHADGTVRLWDPRTGAQNLVLHVGGGVVESVRFAADGSKLVTLDEGGVVRVWALALDDLIELAREKLTRDFSQDECRQYLRLEQCSGS